MRYGLIGEKLGHSFSKTIHEKMGNNDYDIKELPKEDIEAYLKEASFEGINVTIPYKETAMRFCEPSETALAIGCVNTLIKRDGIVRGYNTDTLGFSYMVKRAGIDFKNRDVLILGSGGTSKTAAFTAERLGARSLTVVSRSEKKYDIGVNLPVSFIKYDEIDAHKAQILINTTPVGMYPDNGSTPLNIDKFDNPEAVVDVVYNPLVTELVNIARKRGLKATNGLPMLVAQAWYAERLFFGKNLSMSDEDEAELEAVIKAVYEEKCNTVLIGMPGSGKSTSGRLLAERLHREFYDTDELFLQKKGMSAGDYIEKFGEESFRDEESLIVSEVSRKSGVIIATGGGAVLKEKNVDMLKSNGRLIYLHRELEELETGGRPLSQGSERKKGLYYKRLPIYFKAKDITVKVRDNVSGTVDDIEDKLKCAGAFDDTAPHKKAVPDILVLNGPNLNMLGIREPGIYGNRTYADLMEYILKEAEKLGASVRFFQSNHEGELVDAIQGAYGIYDGIVINPGAYTHTSVALLDAVKAVGIPTVEVHISDVDARDEFRKISYIRAACIGTVSGQGFLGYAKAIETILKEIQG